MNAGSLFVEILLKGDGKALKGLQNLKGGFVETEKNALATKAAILGIIYGLDKMTGWAAHAGLDLRRFAFTTGQSTDNLQKWQLAARMAGSSAEEMTDAVTGISEMMTKAKMGGGMPAEAGILARTVGFDPAKMDDAFYVLEQLQKFAKTQPADISKQVLGAFGINPNIMYVLKQTTSDISKLNAQVLSPRQLAQLEGVNRQWARFWYTLESIGKTIVAGSGNQVVGELNNALAGIIDIAKMIDKMTAAFGGLKTIVMVIGGALLAAFAPITATIAAITLLIADFEKLKTTGKSVIFDKINSVIGNTSLGKLATEKGTASAFFGGEFGAGAVPPNLLTPSAPNQVPAAKGNVTNQANVNIYGAGDNARDIGKQSGKAVMDVFQQLPGGNQ